MDKTILITGATSGIGRAAAEEMAARGWLVIGVGRSSEKCLQAEQEIKAFYPQARLHFLTADLSSQREINRLADAAGQFLDECCNGRLDVLLNNAAAVKDWYTVTEDGYETQFAVNHLAAFLLTMRLLSRLLKSPAGRILTVSSASHKGIRINWQDIMGKRHYSCLRAYKQSKLCNVLFTHELNRRLQDTPVRAFAVDPGLVNTEIGSKNAGGLVAWFWQQRKKYGLSPFQAASTIVYLCKMADSWQTKDSYFKNCTGQKPGRQAFNEEAALRLWDLSASLCGLDAGGLPQRSGSI